MKKSIKSIAFFCLLLQNFIVFAQNNVQTLYVGTYTRKTSEGIYAFKFNTKTGDFDPLSITKGIDNPSFLAIAPNKRFLYSGGSKKGDSVHAFAIDQQTHHLTLLNTQSLAGGIGATHLELDRNGKTLFVSNYRNGSISVLPISDNGQLENVSQSIVLEGKSVHPQQDKPHLHSLYVMPNNKDVFAPDLGTDKIMIYTLNTENKRLTEGGVPFVKTADGAGPRHMAFHQNGKFAYVIQELNSTVTGFHYKNGSLEAFQTIDALPNNYKGQKWSADIHISPDGKFLYASNRAHESLAIFKINKKTGVLTFVAHQNVNGKTPRNFVIDPTGRFVLVANQDSDNITIFKRDKKTGKLMATGKEIKVSMPVCLKFL